MKVLLNDGLIVLVPETPVETDELALWKAVYADHVLVVRPDHRPDIAGLELHDLGERTEACREPLNVVSHSSDPRCRIVSNLANTPFELDGRRYRSVESFWQGLKFASDAERRQIAKLDGDDARQAGSKQGYGATVVYESQEIPVGAWAHWQLMERACQAKFAQSEEAREALLATGNRPLVHIVRVDSKAIPGAIMAQIWTRIRDRLRTDQRA